MADEDDGADAQDLAEAYDETHREGEDPNLFDRDDERDPDLDSRAYDVTRARGDAAEDDEVPAADDDDEVVRIPPEDVRAFDLFADREADKTDDERLDEGLEESFPASNAPASQRPA